MDNSKRLDSFKKIRNQYTDKKFGAKKFMKEIHKRDYNLLSDDGAGPRRKGEDFERFIGALCELAGYDVFLHGVYRRHRSENPSNMSESDEAVDIVATKDDGNELWIQCKYNTSEGYRKDISEASAKNFEKFLHTISSNPEVKESKNGKPPCIVYISTRKLEGKNRTAWKKRREETWDEKGIRSELFEGAYSIHYFAEFLNAGGLKTLIDYDEKIPAFYACNADDVAGNICTGKLVLRANEGTEGGITRFCTVCGCPRQPENWTPPPQPLSKW